MEGVPRRSSRSPRSQIRGYAPLAHDAGVDPLGHGSTVWMQELDEAKALRHAKHVEVSVARDHVEAGLAATLADRAGNRVDITLNTILTRAARPVRP